MPTKLSKPAQRNPFRSFISTASPGEELANARCLPLDMIDVNPHQARQQFDEEALAQLTASIREHGILQPIGVVQIGERYRIIFGERRFRAAIDAEKSEIPAVIYEGLSEADAAILTALENLQREDLDLEDEARQFAYLLEMTGLSQRALADRLGKTHNYISRRVRLLRERPELFTQIREGRLTQKEALGQLANEREVYHGDTEKIGDAGDTEEMESLEGAASGTGTTERQVGVYHGDTLVSVISLDQSEQPAERTPRHEMPQPRAGIPARWQAITRTYRVLGRIQPGEVPIEECEDLARQLEDLEALVSATRRALQARLEDGTGIEDGEGGEGPEESSPESISQRKLF
jgi:ParB/RepB/Spo0J family partition protein